MPTPKILGAILVVVPAALLSMAQAGLSEPAAEECRSKPGSSTPRGGHWYYHSNRADKRQCWYFSPVELHLRHRDQAQADQASTLVPAEDATPIAAEPPVSFAPSAQTIDAIYFSERWPQNLQRVGDESVVDPPSISSSYADTEPAIDTTPQPPLRWPMLRTAAMPTGSTVKTVLNYISFGGLTATASLLLVGWIVKFTRRQPKPRIDERPYASLRPVASPRLIPDEVPNRATGRSPGDASHRGIAYLQKLTSADVQQRNRGAILFSESGSLPAGWRNAPCQSPPQQ